MNTISTNAESFREAVFFSMTIRRFGNRALIKDMSAYDEYRAKRNGQTKGGAVEAGKDANVKATKILLRSEQLNAINEFLGAAKDKLCGRFGKALPSRIKEGLFVVKKSLVQEFEDELRAASAKVTQLTNEFCESGEYQNAIGRARLNDVNDPDNPGLGPLFNARDYPPDAKLKQCFGIEWQWLDLGVPEDLPAALRAEAAEKLDRQMTQAAEEVRTALYAQLGEFLDHLVDKLTPSPDGKAKIFRDSLVENVQSFCACFDSRNFLSDDRLSNLVAKSRAVLDGVTPDKLRKYASVSENTREKFTAIKAELDKAITELPGRQFNLDE